MSLPLVPDANHPAFPTRSQVDDWEIKRPAILDSGEEMAVIGQRCAQAKPSKEHHTDRSHRRRPMRLRTSLRNQPGSRREPRDQHGEHAECEGTYQGKKKEFREAKRRSAEKIKARASAWRNKSEIKTGNGDNTKTNPRDKPKWEDKARS